MRGLAHVAYTFMMGFRDPLTRLPRLPYALCQLRLGGIGWAAFAPEYLPPSSPDVTTERGSTTVEQITWREERAGEEINIPTIEKEDKATRRETRKIVEKKRAAEILNKASIKGRSRGGREYLDHGSG